jgi:hypothetical protein
MKILKLVIYFRDRWPLIMNIPLLVLYFEIRKIGFVLAVPL